uniref:Uncharacterized protein n=1 Tax=Mycena chlorophos TaxID=658473 RepID=A0ABQ0LQI9_MYCCL|nr:predicted protein [Mycena chlorophos]
MPAAPPDCVLTERSSITGLAVTGDDIDDAFDPDRAREAKLGAGDLNSLEVDPDRARVAKLGAGDLKSSSGSEWALVGCSRASGLRRGGTVDLLAAVVLTVGRLRDAGGPAFRSEMGGLFRGGEAAGGGCWAPGGLTKPWSRCGRSDVAAPAEARRRIRGTRVRRGKAGFGNSSI